MLTKTSSPQHHILPLDGLRGLAIIMVMVFHAKPAMLSGGFLGVDIFFVLSGYLITTLLLREVATNGHINLQYFYMRRLLRLFPALILLVAALLITPWVLNLPTHTFTSYFQEALIALFYLTNWARALEINAPDILGHTWSLAVEEQFYLVWPFILILVLRLRHNAHVTILFAALTIAFLSSALRIYMCSQNTPYTRIYNGLDTRADALMIGAALACIILQVKKHSKQGLFVCGLSIFCLPALCALAMLAYTTHWQNPALYYWQFTLTYIATSVVIAFLVLTRKNLITTLFSLRPLVFIGTISYGLYLWHYPIFRILLLSGIEEGATLLLYGTFISLLVATASYYLIEKPLLQLKVKFR